MDQIIEDWVLDLVNDFINYNWKAFKQHCEAFGVDENEVFNDYLYNYPYER